MVMPRHTSTDGIETSTGVLWDERESIRIVGFMGVPNTFSGLQPPTTVPNIYSVYRPLFDIVSPRFARGEELGYEQYFDIEHSSNNLHSLLSLINYIDQDKTSSTYPILDLLSLERHYVFRNRSEVMEFTVNNSFLLQPLYEAYKQIRNYFGASAQAVLEVVVDPEFFEDQELVIFIRTDLSPDEAFEKMERMDDEWWLNVPATVRKNLCIDVEFI